MWQMRGFHRLNDIHLLSHSATPLGFVCMCQPTCFPVHIHIHQSCFEFDGYLHRNLNRTVLLQGWSDCFRRTPFKWRTMSQPDRLKGSLCFCRWVDKFFFAHPQSFWMSFLELCPNTTSPLAPSLFSHIIFHICNFFNPKGANHLNIVS